MPTSNSPKATADSNPKKISTSVMELLTEHKDAIPRIVARQTARISAMNTNEATQGRQLAPRSKKKETANPIPLPTHPESTPKRSSRARRSMNARDPPDNDPEDDPDGEYTFITKKRRLAKKKRYYSSDSDNEHDSSSSSDAGFAIHNLVDDSDEEERGDQSRRSPDHRDSSYSRETLRAFYDGDDSTP